jgi:hypothetical protein
MVVDGCLSCLIPQKVRQSDQTFHPIFKVGAGAASTAGAEGHGKSVNFGGFFDGRIRGDTLIQWVKGDWNFASLMLGMQPMICLWPIDN